jgi:sulfite exporter TauE/SafE
MPELDVGLLLAAWLTGLAGSGGHCLGMCGGIVGALGLRQRSGLQGFGIAVAAHAGRVLGYAAAGALVGFAGATAFGSAFGPDGIWLLRLCAAAVIAAIGLQLLLGRPLLTPLERAGAKFWRRLAPLLRALLPPRTTLSALAAGALWGWLPCGLVYAQLGVAAVAGSALQGAALMAVFGLGTSVGLSLLSALLQSLGLARLPRRAAGVLLVLFAVSTTVPLFHESHTAVDASAQPAHEQLRGHTH